MRISDWSSDVCSSDLVFVCLESWLNERAEPQARGTVLAGYMIALYAGQAIGQFLLNAGGVRPSLPFMIASILISLAAIPVALTRIDAPTPSGHAPLGLRSLYAVSPLGIVRSEEHTSELPSLM